MKVILLFILGVTLSQCYLRKNTSNLSQKKQSEDFGFDYNTFSNYKEVEAVHYDLYWNLDLEKQVVDATIVLEMESQIDNLKIVNLDMWDQKIDSVYFSNEKQKKTDNQDEIHQVYYTENVQQQQLNFQIIEMIDQGEQGQQLQLQLDTNQQKGSVFYLTINYSFKDSANAVSFLTPEQTSTKILPYMYSQCEPIYCRSMMPSQDTPSVKSTYNAEVIANKGLNVYMSANKTGTEEYGSNQVKHIFENTIRIPSYLVAIIAGNVEERQVGKRSYVITEPDMMDESAKDLEFLEDYLIAIEDYTQIPYIWGSYKIVIMPPSFPFGGMENPLLTFASPSIITGDKSGISVAIHEIAHSWSGNMVTCSNWQNMWINEGFTVFLERKAQIAIYGYDYMVMDSIVGNSSLINDINGFGRDSNYSTLYPWTPNTNPDDSFSTIPYEKGYQILFYLQSIMGEDEFQSMMTSWFAENAFQSKTWLDFRDHFESYVKENFENPNLIITQAHFEQWIYVPGQLPNDVLVKIHFESDLQKDAIYLAQSWINVKVLGNQKPQDWENYFSFTSDQKYVFLDYLNDKHASLNPRVMKSIDQSYELTQSTNFELSYRWFQTSILVGYEQNKEDVFEFLGKIGRQKFVVPQYTAYVQTGQKEYAQSIFEHYYDFYHPIARLSIQNALSQ